LIRLRLLQSAPLVALILCTGKENEMTRPEAAESFCCCVENPRSNNLHRQLGLARRRARQQGFLFRCGAD